MDLKTSFVFYLVSMALYVSVLTAMALVDKRVIGTRWLAYSVLTEMVKTVLQMLAPSIPRLFSTMVASELNVLAFFTMYIGLRWFVERQTLRSKVWPAAMLVLMAVYCAMFVLHIRYASLLITAMVLWCCGAIVRMLLKQHEDRFRLPAVITSMMLAIIMGVVIYRGTLAIEAYQKTDWRMPAGDPRWDNSMLALVMLAHCLLIMSVWFAAAEMYSAVEATAGIDALTGCLNRRALMKLAAHEVARSERSGMPLTIAILDLDHFKQVNDTYGHAAGDDVLCALVVLLQNRLRSVDVVARIGGEEFLLLLPDTDVVNGARVVEGLLQAVAAMQVGSEGQLIKTTVSAGITQGLPRSDSWPAMMNRADRALYEAKKTGRNRVVVDELAMRLPRRALGARSTDHKEIPEDSQARLAGLTESAIRLIWKRLG
jgi:diguanylate cyclase (GGDEF)-like protein